MKVKVTLELNVEDGLDDRGSIDMAVEDALFDVGTDLQMLGPDKVWEIHKIKWEAV
jgi:hypothetical protein